MGTDFSKLNFDKVKIPNMVTNPPIPPMIQKQIAEDERKEQEFALLVEQNNQLKANFEKLEELCNLKDTELKEANQEAEKIKKYNTKMLIISLVAAISALASLVATILIALFFK